MADRYGARLAGRIDPNPNPYPTAVPPVSGTEAYLGTHIALRTLDLSDMLAPGSTGVPVVGALPSLPDAINYPQGYVVFLTTDNKLYRSTGSTWTTLIDSVDLAANSVTTNAILAGAVTAAKISVSQLSALAVDVGTLTAGKIENGTAGILLSGSVPGGWTRYLNLNGSGTFLRHERLELNYDGTAKFFGQVDITDAQISYNLQSVHISLHAPGVAHGMTSLVPTDVHGVISYTNPLTGGLNLIGFSETDRATDIQAYPTDLSSAAKAAAYFSVGKKSGSTVAAIASTEIGWRFSNFGTTVAELYGDGKLVLGAGGSAQETLSAGKLTLYDGSAFLAYGSVSGVTRFQRDSAEQINLLGESNAFGNLQLATATVDTRVVAGGTGGGETLSLKPGTSADHSYLGIYADSASPSTRFAYIGYGGAGTEQLDIWQQRNAIMRFATNNTGRWDISAAGHLLAVTDNSWDIGASGATRPRDIYAANIIYAGARFVPGSLGLRNTGDSASIVLGSAATGWGNPTGTATRTTFATSTVTLPQLAERVKALIDDLKSHHGLIAA